MNLHFRIFLFIFCSFALIGNKGFTQDGIASMRSMRYVESSETQTLKWQEDLRRRLFKILKINELFEDRKNGAIPLQPLTLSSIDKGSYFLRKIEINSTLTRRIKLLVTIPKKIDNKLPAVICLHGHGGTEDIVYDKSTVYKGFADILASSGYITVAPFVSQHEVYEKGMILMGERLFDCIRAVDLITTLPEADTTRLGCAGLSLGGEMAMWLGAMDIRIKATLSSGFLTKMDHLEQNHCLCWKFEGLRQLVDFSDIYSLIAPRALMCQNGVKEPESQFNVTLARRTFTEIQPIYSNLGFPDKLLLDIHEGGHEVDIPALLYFFNKFL